MKLLHKTIGLYLLFSTLMLAVVGCILYGLLTQIIEAEITEKLLVNKDRIVLQLEAGKMVPSLPPVIEIDEISTHSPDSVFIKNTVLFDPIEGEEELFREIRSVEIISGKTYIITLRQVILEPHDYFNSIGLVLLLGFVILLLGLLWQNWRIAQKIWHPFFENLKMLKKFDVQNEKPVQLFETDVIEFRELNVTIEYLTQKAHTDYQSLKEFTENASHEMQTPLSVVRVKLDEALQSPNLTEQQALQLEIAHSAVQRLTRLNHALLLLVKIENHQFQKAEIISVLSRIKVLIADLDDFLKEKQLTLKIEILNEPYVEANPILLNTLFSNLLTNAIRHNIKGGEINVKLNKSSLLISNTGLALGVAPEQLFERFKKGRMDEESVGLGLAIAKSICDNCGWEISYRHELGRHVFCVVF